MLFLRARKEKPAEEKPLERLNAALLKGDYPAAAGIAKDTSDIIVFNRAKVEIFAPYSSISLPEGKRLEAVGLLLSNPHFGEKAAQRLREMVKDSIGDEISSMVREASKKGVPGWAVIGEVIPLASSSVKRTILSEAIAAGEADAIREVIESGRDFNDSYALADYFVHEVKGRLKSNAPIDTKISNYAHQVKATYNLG